MIVSLLLSLAMAGQCGPAGCPYRPHAVLPHPATVQIPSLDWGWHLINYKGSTAWIWGYHLDAQTICSYATPVPICEVNHGTTDR